MSMMTENYCNECDEVVHAVFDSDDFYAHRIGTVKCPVCGATIEPCNECEDHDACGDCPWKNVPATEAMSYEAYVRYERANSPKLFKMFKDGDFGPVYQKISIKIEKDEKKGKKRC